MKQKTTVFCFGAAFGSAIFLMLSAFAAAYLFSPLPTDGTTVAPPTVFARLFPLWLCLFLFCLVMALYWGKAAKREGGKFTMLTERLQKIRAPYLFLCIGGVTLACSLIYIWINHETVWEYLLFRGGDDLFMDFFNHVAYVNDPQNVYATTIHACFPAFAYLFYFVIGRFLPDGAAVMHAPDAMSPTLYVAYLIYTVVSVAFLVWLVNKFLACYGVKVRMATVVLLLFSNVFLDVFERGNSVLLVLLFLLAAMLLRESPRALHRELALLLIAAAAGFKVYPALFGVLYLFEKRYAEALRLLVYGIMFFFVPFVFFGGIDGFLLFLENQTAVQGEVYISLSSIKAAVQCLSLQITGDVFAWNALATVLPYLFAVLCAISLFDRKLAMWERTFLIVSVMAFFPAWSGGYTSVFFLIPFLLLLRDLFDGLGTGKQRCWHLLALIVFSLSFSMVALILPNGSPLYTVRYLLYYVLDLVLIVKALFSLVRTVYVEKKHMSA